MTDVTFPSSYLTESLKLGDSRMAQALKKQLGLNELDAKDVGLPLSFSEDRALTAVQSLFAFGGLQPQEMVRLTPHAEKRWGCSELLVMVVEVKAYCRAYAQGGDVPAETALGALKTLAGRVVLLRLYGRP